jgi:hypothetical protein
MMGNLISPEEQKQPIGAHSSLRFLFSGSWQPACFGRFSGKFFREILYVPGLTYRCVIGKKNRPIQSWFHSRIDREGRLWSDDPAIEIRSNGSPVLQQVAGVQCLHQGRGIEQAICDNYLSCIRRTDLRSSFLMMGNLISPEEQKQPIGAHSSLRFPFSESWQPACFGRISGKFFGEILYMPGLSYRCVIGKKNRPIQSWFQSRIDREGRSWSDDQVIEIRSNGNPY